MRRARRWALLCSLLVLAGAVQAAPAAAQSGCVLGLLCSPPPAANPPSAACAGIGTADRNPTDARVEPRLGSPLLARRADGRPQLGFNDYAAWDHPPRATYAEDMALHRRVGSGLIRIGLPWGHIERTRDRYDWASNDQLYCAAVANGVRPLFVLLGSPVWAVADITECIVSPCSNPPKSTFDYKLEAFAEAAAIRYPDALFEVWNEPNLESFWGSQPSPHRYGAITRSVYRGIKDGNPDAPVLAGALSNNQTDGPGRSSVLTFLRGMYAAGLADHMDGVSFHPAPVYPDPAREVATRTFDQVQAVLAENGEQGSRHIVASETGASTTHADGATFTQAQQSEWLRRVYDTASSHPNVDAVAYHTLIELHSGPKLGYGWVHRKDGAGKFRAKQVYCDFAAAFGNAFDCAQPIPVQ